MTPILLSSMVTPSSQIRTIASIRRKRRRRKLFNSLLKSILENLDTNPSLKVPSLSLQWPPISAKHRMFRDPVTATYLRLSTNVQPSALPAGQLNQDPRIFLEEILKAPILWYDASDTTFENERRLRPRPVRSGSLLQRLQIRIASPVEKPWPARCTRTQNPKGLYNPANYCYRRSVMQCLLHLPQFMHWIDTHGQGANTCSGTTQRPNSVKKSSYTPRCLTCAMRAFIPAYWNPANTASEIPYAAVKAFDIAVKDSPVVRSSSLTSHQQEDADQFLAVLLNAFESATPTAVWRDQFASLFRLTATNTDTCRTPGCGTRSHPPVGAETALRLHPHAPKAGTSDTLAACIRRNFASERISKRCSKCTKPSDKQPDRVHVRTQTIDSAPDILVVQLVIYDAYGRKVHSRVKFDDYIDLTPYQSGRASSLKYKLSSVVSHQGSSARSGHYIAHVSGPQHTHIISDTDVRKTRAQTLSAAVQVPPSGGKFDPYLLFYTRTT